MMKTFNLDSFRIFLGFLAIVIGIFLFFFSKIFGKKVETLPITYKILLIFFIFSTALVIYIGGGKKEESKTAKISPPQKTAEKIEEAGKSTIPKNAKKAGKRKEEDLRTVDGRDQPDKFMKGVDGDKGFQVAARGIQETFDNLSMAIAAKNWSRVYGFFHNDFKAKGTKGYLLKEDWIAMLKDSGEMTLEFREIIRDEAANSKLVKIEIMKQGKSFQENYRVVKTGNSWKIIAKL